jgi:hypothetical protein
MNGQVDTNGVSSLCRLQLQERVNGGYCLISPILVQLVSRTEASRSPSNPVCLAKLGSEQGLVTSS